MEGRYRVAAAGAGLLAASIGGVHLVAWLTGEMYARGFEAITMKTNAALCLVLCGVALACTALGAGGAGVPRLGRALAVIAMTIGGLTFLEHLGDWDFGIDQLLAEEPPGAMSVLYPNRMGPPGALSFFLSGAALLLLHGREEGEVRAGQWLGVLVCLVGLLTFLGHIFGAKHLYGVALYTAIAWPTTVALISLGVGIIIARPREGMMALVAAPGPGGAAIRRLLPAALILPILLGWLRLQGEWHGLYERYFGTSILVLSWIIIFSILIYKTAGWLNRSAEDLAISEKRYRSFVQASSQIVWRVNAIGAADEEIPEWQEYTGQSWEETRDFGWMEAIRPEDRERVAQAWEKAYEKGNLYEVEYAVRRRDGEWRRFLARGVPILNAEGGIREWVGTGIDITEQARAEAALRAKEEQFRQLAEALPQLVWIAGGDGEVEYLNGKWFEYTGSAPDASLGSGWGQFLHPDDAPEVGARWKRSLETGEAYQAEYRLRRADGEYHWFIARALPVHDEEGRVVRWFGTSTDIEDHRRARDLAEAAARAKADFMANMSHEIRTPMNGIIGITDLLLQSEIGEVQRHYLEMVKHSAEALRGVVDDVLDFSRMEAGAAVVERVEFDLHETVENVADALSLTAFQKGLELAVIIDPEVPRMVFGDPAKLRHVLLNLVGNAVKFTDEGEVAVRVRSAAHDAPSWRLAFEVRDTGIGIPKKKQGILFQSFTQLDTSASRGYGGTGLGLAISRRLAELMGGSIEVESAEGVGSLFRFELEFGAPDQPQGETLRCDRLAGKRALVVDDNATNRLMLEQTLKSKGLEVESTGLGNAALSLVLEAASQERPYDYILVDMHLPDMEGDELVERLRGQIAVEGCCLLMISLDKMTDGAVRSRREGAAYLVKPIRVSALISSLIGLQPCTTGESRARPELAPPEPQSLLCTHILVAEDNPVNLTVTEALLRRAGARVTSATDGAAAVEACLASTFNVVLMDVQMPGMDGVEATRILREKGVRVPVLGLTAHALDGDRQRCLEAGMDDYLVKPVTAEALHQKVAHWARLSPVGAADAGALLGQLDGDREIFRTVVETFLENAPGQFAEVVAAIEAADADRLEKGAHRLKGALGVVGADTARCMAEKVEKSAKGGNLAGARVIVAEMEAEIGRVLEQLQAQLRS